MFASELGSPFLTTSDATTLHSPTLPARASSEPPTLLLNSGPNTPPPRPHSPSPSMGGFSIIGPEEVQLASDLYTNPSPVRSFGRRAAVRSTPALNYFPPSTPSPSPGIKSIFPKLWDSLVSSPNKSSNRHTMYNFSPVPATLRKGKQKAPKLDPYFYDPYVDYTALPPLDGEEGELIDDEACFVAVDFWGIEQATNRARVVTGIDILSLLPPELAFHILALLCTPSPSHILTTSSLKSQAIQDPLPDLLTCLAVSHTWRHLANDNSVWRALFIWRWGSVIDTAIPDYLYNQERQMRRNLGLLTPYKYTRRTTSLGANEVFNMSLRDKKLPALPPGVVDQSSAAVPITLDYQKLFKDRYELEQRWLGQAYVPADPYPYTIEDPFYDLDTPPRASTKWAPKMTQIVGHRDSVYCLEFTSQHIITGSRDKTIRVWSLRTGRCLGVFGGNTTHADDWDEVRGHTGSVLCLKFVWDDDEDLGVDEELEQETVMRRQRSASVGDRLDSAFEPAKGKIRKGTLFSGSSDSTICVWELNSRTPSRARGNDFKERRFARDWRMEGGEEEEEYEVKATVKNVLRGHGGGVLDLRVDDTWIVSCSKDTVIRVWNRENGSLHRTLRGHEGPVNAIGLEGGRVVSASGDGKMILWDVQSGERLMTFDGHEKGLACIEFKGDLIVSGSNDCDIKIWSATTGQCLRTLIGHESLVRALSFDPRSGRLVSASYDKSVKVWDVESGNVVREFRNIHTSQIFDVKFDAMRIVSTSHDQKIVILDFSEGIDSVSLFQY